jgi:hypothetical protein
VDGCAGLGSVYFNRRQRTYQRRHQAEGHVGCCAWLGRHYFLCITPGGPICKRVRASSID